MKLLVSILLPLILLFLSGCAPGESEVAPPEIRYGEDLCVECNMIISDVRFASGYAHEVAPNRYESLAFDDIGDMLVHASKHPEHRVVTWYVHDYSSQDWLDGPQAHYVFSSQLHTPMGQGTAAHATLEAAQDMAAELDGEVLDWDGLLARHGAGKLIVDALAAPVTAGEQPAHEHTAHRSLSKMDQGVEQEVILGEADVEGYHLQVATHEPLHTGYNSVMVHLTDAAGNPVEDAVVAFEPQMDMADGKQHSAAVEQPAMQRPGMFHGAVAFPMPGGPEIGAWTLAVRFEDPTARQSGEASFDIEVLPSKLAGSFVAPDDRKIFLMAIRPTMPQVGVQPFELFAMEKRGVFDWPPLDSLTLVIEPWMPTMDHGSTQNENPLSEGAGHYLGKVNFSMAGPWAVTVSAEEGGVTLGDVVFEYEIP